MLPTLAWMAGRLVPAHAYRRPLATHACVFPLVLPQTQPMGTMGESSSICGNDQAIGRLGWAGAGAWVSGPAWEPYVPRSASTRSSVRLVRSCGRVLLGVVRLGFAEWERSNRALAWPLTSLPDSAGRLGWEWV